MMKRANVVGLIILLLSMAAIGSVILWSSSQKPESKDYFTAAVIEGTVAERIISNYQRVDTVKTYHELYQLLSAVSYGRVDVAIADRFKSLAVQKSGIYRNLKPVGSLFEQEAQRVTFRAADNSLRQMFNRGLAEIINNGMFIDISERYFGCNILNGTELNEVYPDETSATDDSWERERRKGTVIFAFSVMNPPYSYLNKQNKLEGFEVELARAISEQLGIKHFKAVSAPENQVFWELSTGKYDGVFGFNNTKAIDSKFKFSDTYCITGLQLFVRMDSEITGPETLEPTIFPEPPPMQSL